MPDSREGQLEKYGLNWEIAQFPWDLKGNFSKLPHPFYICVLKYTRLVKKLSKNLMHEEFRINVKQSHLKFIHVSIECLLN